MTTTLRHAHRRFQSRAAAAVDLGAGSRPAAGVRDDGKRCPPSPPRRRCTWCSATRSCWSSGQYGRWSTLRASPTRTSRSAGMRAPEATPADLAAALSPSLFAEARVIVLDGAHEAGKDASAAVLDHAIAPGDGITVVVLHAGGARNKALADALRKAGAQVARCEKLRAGRAGRLRPLGGAPGPREDHGRGGRRADRGGGDRAARARRRRGTARRRHRGHRGRGGGAPLPPRPRRGVGLRGGGQGRGRRPRWARSRRCAGRWCSASRRCWSRTRWPTPCARSPRSAPRAAATRTGWPACSGCRHGRSARPSRRSVAGTRTPWRWRSAAAAEANADVKGAAPDVGYALERAVLRMCAARETRG